MWKGKYPFQILKTVTLYLKENHHPSAFRPSKEAREIEDDFERAQRSWRRQFDKVEKAKKAYHGAARSERSAQLQVAIDSFSCSSSL